MFCFFINDSFANFWSNKVGDIFCELTIAGMKWDNGQVDLVYYPFLDGVPQFYEFDSNKTLTIKKEVIGYNEVTVQDENGNDVVKVEESKSYVTDRTIDPIVYYSKGLMVKPC